MRALLAVALAWIVAITIFALLSPDKPKPGNRLNKKNNLRRRKKGNRTHAHAARGRRKGK
jgi:hypothetical protein